MKLLLAGFSQQLAAIMGDGLGMDADALFSTFCNRLFITPAAATAGDQPKPQAEEAEIGENAETSGQATSAPSAPADAIPPALPGAPPQSHAAGPANRIATTSAAALTNPGFNCCSPANRGRPFDRRQQSFRRGRSRMHRATRDMLVSAPPTRRLCYAACAGPP